MRDVPRTPALGDRWRQDLPQVAQMYAGLWARGVAIQADRVQSGDDDREKQLIDAILYLFCLRNLMRAAELVGDSLASDDLGAAQLALTRFEARCPDVASARDWLEHFDAYALGLGRDREANQGRTPLRIRLEAVGDTHVVRLLARGRSRRVGMREATAVAVALWLDLDQADAVVDECAGQPPDEDG